MAILGRLSGGPLEGQIIPLDVETLDEVDDELVLPWNQGQLVYRRVGDPVGTGEHDGPTTFTFDYDSTASNNPVPED